MPYATRDDLVARFSDSEIEELESVGGEGAVDTACADAEAEANSYLSMRLALPLPETPEAVKVAVCDIARYRLYKSRATEEVTVRYTQAIRWLVRVSQGKARVTFSASIDSNVRKRAALPMTVSGSNTGAVFSDEVLGRMVE